MPTNIVDQLRDEIASQLSATAGQTLGLSADKAQNAIHATIPAMLASFLGVASSPSGATALNNAADQASRSTAASADSAIQSGTSLLGSLLGDAKLQSLTGALSIFVGLNPRGASSLLGMAAPLILGFLGRQGSAAGQGSQGLASLLLGQKEAIMSALPPRLSQLLGSSGLLEGVTGAGQVSRDAVAGAVSTPATAASTQQVSVPASQVPPVAQSSSWLRPALGALAAVIVILGLWQFLSGRRGQEPVQQAVNKAEQAPGSAQPVAEQTAVATKEAATTAVNGSDLDKQVLDNLGRLGQTLNGITDLATAKSAVPQLQEIAGGLDQVKSLAGQIQGPSRQALADLIGKGMPSVQAAVQRVYAIPGASDVLKPIMDPMLAALASLQRV